MKDWIPVLILVSAIAYLIYQHQKMKQRDEKSSFQPPPYDYSDQSEDGLGTGVFPPSAPRRHGEESMFDGLPEDDPDEAVELPGFLKNGVQGPPPQNRIVRPRRVTPDDRRPASDGDMLLNALLLGTATGVPMSHDEARAVVGEVLREEGASNYKQGRHGNDAPEPSRASDDDRPGFGGGSSNYSSPDPGGSSGADSGSGGGGGE